MLKSEKLIKITGHITFVIIFIFFSTLHAKNLDKYDNADNIADYSNSCLFKWLSEIPSRASFEDMSSVIGIMDDSVDLGYLARLRQIEEIEIMGSNLIYHFTQGE